MFDTDYIKTQVSIVDLISVDESLRQEGGRLVGVHGHADSEGRRCLSVDPDKNLWNCFHCGVGGDIFSYVMDRDGCSFVEAAVWICEKYSVPMPEWSAEDKEKWVKRQEEKRSVRDLMRMAFGFYHEQVGERDYFAKRGISSEWVEKLLLGYAPPGGRALVEFLMGELGITVEALGKARAKGQEQEFREKAEQIKAEMLGTGLFFEQNDGQLKDRYEDRYIFPYWKSGEIVYSIGRTIDPKVESHKKYVKHLVKSDKYPFVSDSAVEHVIWGIDSLKGREECLICEGIVDAVLAYQHGFAVLSPVTKQFRNEDIERLVELTERVKTAYIVYDNEKSGEGLKGGLKTAEALFRAGRDVRMVTLPRSPGVDKVDLADFLNEEPFNPNKSRAEDLRSLLNQSPDYIGFLVGECRKLDGRAKGDELSRIVDQMSLMPDERLGDWVDLIVEASLSGRRVVNRMIKDARTAREKTEKEKRLKEAEERLKRAEFLRFKINEIRAGKRKIFQTKQMITTVVIGDLEECGKFYRTADEMYWFSADRKELFELESEEFALYINHRFGVNPSEAEHAFIIEELKTVCGSRGIETAVRRFAYYDEKQATLYIDNNDNGVFVLDGKSIQLRDNGVHGVLFLRNKLHDKFEYQPGKHDIFDQIMVDSIHFSSGDEVNLEPSEQRFLFRVWCFSLFFESIQPTKPLMFLLGEKGSGKTTIQRMVGKWLFGRNFDVTTVSKEGEDDFVAAITNNSFVALDNVDSPIGWLPDYLARVATGGRIQKRELYTTNTEVIYFPKVFLALNARTPRFKRDDIVDRLLIFRVSRREEFIAEKAVLGKVAGSRDLLWSEILQDLNRIVLGLKTDKSAFSSSFRMADFAEFGWRCVRSFDVESGGMWVELLKKMDKAQSDFLMEDNSIYGALTVWLEKPVNRGREVKISELFAELEAITDDEALGWGFKSATSLGRIFRQMLSDLRKYFRIEDEQKNRAWHYRIWPKKSENE